MPLVSVIVLHITLHEARLLILMSTCSTISFSMVVIKLYMYNSSIIMIHFFLILLYINFCKHLEVTH